MAYIIPVFVYLFYWLTECKSPSIISTLLWIIHMYTAYLLSDATRKTLLELFPPKYSTVICHHITIQYPATKDTEVPEQPKSCQIVGYLDDGKGLECFIVAVNGNTKRPYDGKIFHITHSLDSLLGYKPVDSNTLIADSNGYRDVEPIDLDVTPKLL